MSRRTQILRCVLPLREQQSVVLGGHLGAYLRSGSQHQRVPPSASPRRHRQPTAPACHFHPPVAAPTGRCLLAGGDHRGRERASALPAWADPVAGTWFGQGALRRPVDRAHPQPAGGTPRPPGRADRQPCGAGLARPGHGCLHNHAGTPMQAPLFSPCVPLPPRSHQPAIATGLLARTPHPTLFLRLSADCCIPRSAACALPLLWPALPPSPPPGGMP